MQDALAEYGPAVTEPEEFVEDGGVIRIGPDWKRDNDVTFMRLLMTAAHADEAEIATWSDEQCQQADVWAIAASLNASDNDDIVVPPMPAHVRWPAH